jgi:transposase
MFFPEGQVRVFLYGEPVDMRKSFTGLYALTKGVWWTPLSRQFRLKIRYKNICC